MLLRKREITAFFVQKHIEVYTLQYFKKGLYGNQKNVMATFVKSGQKRSDILMFLLFLQQEIRAKPILRNNIDFTPLSPCYKKNTRIVITIKSL